MRIREIFLTNREKDSPSALKNSHKNAIDEVGLIRMHTAGFVRRPTNRSESGYGSGMTCESPQEHLNARHDHC